MSDFAGYMILAGLLMVPAVITFIILTVLRVRRGRFHYNKRSAKKSDDSAE